MRCAAVFLAAAGLGFGVLAAGAAGAAPAQSAVVTTITGWSTTPVSATVGYALAVPVRVRTGSSYVTRSVVVQRRQAGVATWTQVSTKQTAANGQTTVWLNAPAVGAWDFRLVVPATATAAAASSAPRRVTGLTGLATTVSGWPAAAVTALPGAVLSAPVRVQTGSAYLARNVQIQRRATGATQWTTVVTGATAADGRYEARFTVPQGVWQFRVVVPVSQAARAGLSGAWPVTGKNTPGRVTGLAMTGRSPASISLAWSNPQNADFAAVVVRRVMGGIPPASATVGTAMPLSAAKATSVVDRGLEPGTQYSYAVFTRDTSGNTRMPGVTITARTLEAMRLASVSAGASHTCGLGSGGKAWCWGSDLVGQVGDGADGQTDESVPVAVAGGRAYRLITAGSMHTCALSTLGKAWCWGWDSEGQVGDGTGQPEPLAPVSVAGNRTFTSLSAGGLHTCALDATGKAWCWGWNGYGQLGNGGTEKTSKDAPVAVAGGHTFTTISAGARHTCALDPAGSAWCWGDDTGGALGDGDDDDAAESTPVNVAGGHTFTAISAGAGLACALDSEDRAWCWGYDEAGQLGDGDGAGPEHVPVPVVNNHTFASIKAGSVHTCAVDWAGVAWCWGSDESGQLGDGNDGQAEEYAPVAVAGGRALTAISAGNSHTCALDTREYVWCWGLDQDGQVGDGNDGQADKYAPVPVVPGAAP